MGDAINGALAVAIALGGPFAIFAIGCAIAEFIEACAKRVCPASPQQSDEVVTPEQDQRGAD